MIPTEAVVYIPDDLECDDGLYARQGIAHGERRGYRIAGVLRKVEHVLSLAAEGAVVVVAKLAHARSLKAGTRYELVGEETCRLMPIVQEVAAHRSGSPWDEGPTVAILDRFRHNGRVPSGPRDDGGFAERFLRERSRRS